VDDDSAVLDGLRDVLYRSFDVHTAAGGLEGLEILRRDPDSFAVVVSDMRMPGMSGSEFLRAARVSAPDVVRVLLTGDADIETAVRAVNDGQLFRFLTKPCDAQELMRACAAALGQHNLHAAERVLLEQTVRGSVDALVEVLALTNPAAFGRGGRYKELAGRLARAAGVRNWWEVEVAAMLAHVGAVALPQVTAEKLYAGGELTPQETVMVSRVPVVTRQLISKIPRMEGVLRILDTYRDASASEEGVGAPTPAPAGAHVLRIAVDYAELEAQHSAPSVALGAMRSRDLYDRGLLDLFSGIVGVDTAPRVREICTEELRPGMTLAEDARTRGDQLLVASGQRVTERLIELLVNLGPGQVREPLRVVEDGDRP
jgi:response regulator RpfG family c-di-GMP phosphodiesterase